MGELYLKRGEIMKSFISDEDKSMIRELYKNGVSIKEIDKRLNKYNYESIKKYIQRNLKDLKDTHTLNRLHTIETLKKTKFECSREISDFSFYKYNKSIYKIDNNGNLVIDKKVAPIVTFDTPKKIKMKMV